MPGQNVLVVQLGHLQKIINCLGANFLGAVLVVGVPAEGWNICVADATATNQWVPITTDGACNKEPDWAPLEKDAR